MVLDSFRAKVGDINFLLTSVSAKILVIVEIIHPTTYAIAV